MSLPPTLLKSFATVPRASQVQEIVIVEASMPASCAVFYEAGTSRLLFRLAGFADRPTMPQSPIASFRLASLRVKS